MSWPVYPHFIPLVSDLTIHQMYRSLNFGLDVVHGDIKPDNILVFPDDNHTFLARVSDFGFSVIKSNSSGFSKLPFSMNWNAPEYHRREFSVKAAKKMDIYSCGLVCMQVLFNKTLNHAIRETINLAEVQGTTQLGVQNEYTSAIYTLKENDGIRHLASRLVEETTEISSETKLALVEFFNQSLHRDPDQRSTLIENLIPLLIGGNA